MISAERGPETVRAILNPPVIAAAWLQGQGDQNWQDQGDSGLSQPQSADLARLAQGPDFTAALGAPRGTYPVIWPQLAGGSASDLPAVAPALDPAAMDLEAWLDAAEINHIGLYDRQEEQLVIIYDAAHHSDPQLSLITDDDNGQVWVLLDGYVIAMVQGPLTLEDLHLLPA